MSVWAGSPAQAQTDTTTTSWGFDYEFDGENSVDQVFNVIMIIMDVFFILDIYFQLNLARFEKGVLIDDKIRIRQSYVKGWFPVDAAAASSSVISIFSLLFKSDKEEKGNESFMKILRMLRMIRVAKVAKLGNTGIPDRLFPGFSVLQRLLSIMMLIIVTAHMCSSVFVLLEEAVPFCTADDCEDYDQSVDFGWLQAYLEGRGVDYDENWQTNHRSILVQKYILALYWGIITMTTVGCK